MDLGSDEDVDSDDDLDSDDGSVELDELLIPTESRVIQSFDGKPPPLPPSFMTSTSASSSCAKIDSEKAYSKSSSSNRNGEGDIDVWKTDDRIWSWLNCSRSFLSTHPRKDDITVWRERWSPWVKVEEKIGKYFGYLSRCEAKFWYYNPKKFKQIASESTKMQTKCRQNLKIGF